ncbi:nucleotidyltransferase family protein [Microvirga ossetica]|nr:nucleotidyltransferase domain-containing protein [Microvirga ossetica]
MTDDRDKPDTGKTLGEALREMGFEPAAVPPLKIRSGAPATRRLKLHPLPGTLRHVRATVLNMKDDLEARGIVHVWVYGSVARQSQREDSDVDLIVEIAPEAGMTHTGLARLQADLSDALQRRADLTRWHSLKDRAGETARQEAVLIF